MVFGEIVFPSHMSITVLDSQFQSTSESGACNTDQGKTCSIIFMHNEYMLIIYEDVFLHTIHPNSLRDSMRGYFS